MKTIGLLGGTSWVSTIDYYRYLNQFTNEKLGGDDTAKIVLYSFNYGDIVRMTKADDLPGLLNTLTEAAIKLENAGAEMLLLCANTMHRFAEQLQTKTKLPIVHIADVTGNEIRRQCLRNVALLGTRFTMELDFYKNRLAVQQINTIIPSDSDCEFIHRSIYDELGKNIFKSETKARYIEIIKRLATQGAEGVILGCTEIPLLINAEDSPIPVFDTTMLHAKTAIDLALSERVAS
jgi:aspartate racemase